MWTDERWQSAAAAWRREQCLESCGCLKVLTQLPKSKFVLDAVKYYDLNYLTEKNWIENLMTIRQCDLARRAQNSGSMFLYTRPSRDADDEFLDSLFDKQWRKETLSGNPTVVLPKAYLALSLQCPRRPAKFVFNPTSPTQTNPLQTDNPFNFYVTR